MRAIIFPKKDRTSVPCFGRIVGKPHLIRLSTGQLLCCSSSERNFIGPTVAYAYMQAVGMVNDHLVDCFRYREILREIANAN